MNHCEICNTETKNPKFCSRSCSAINSNRKTPKRSLGKIRCKICEAPIKSGRSYCKTCFQDRVKGLTLEEACYNYLHASSAWALVRTRARAVVKEEPRICEVCGYSKHVEVAHIKAVSSFPRETLISIVNSRDNLRILCRN